MTSRLPNVEVPAGDPDAYIERQVTDNAGNNLTFTPVIQVGDGTGPADITGTWQGAAAPTRVVRVPVGTLTETCHLWLKVTGGTDIDLGWVEFVTRD